MWTDEKTMESNEHGSKINSRIFTGQRDSADCQQFCALPDCCQQPGRVNGRNNLYIQFTDCIGYE